MDAARVALDQLRSKILGLGAEYADPDLGPRLEFVAVDKGFRVYCWGEDAIAEELAAPPIADYLVSLTVDGPDVGANGVREWNLEAFASATTRLPSLRHLRLASTGVDHHNRTIVSARLTLDEGGVLRAIADNAPNLESLFSPSAPRPDFWSARLENLTHLWIDAGFEPHGFIEEMARGPLPPKLRGFSWGEYNERYLDDWERKTTPFHTMRSLVGNPSFRQIQVFTLKNPTYSDLQLQELADAAPTLRSLTVVRGDMRQFRPKRA